MIFFRKRTEIPCTTTKFTKNNFFYRSYFCSLFMSFDTRFIYSEIFIVMKYYTVFWYRRFFFYVVFFNICFDYTFSFNPCIVSSIFSFVMDIIFITAIIWLKNYKIKLEINLMKWKEKWEIKN